jgi:hypothetical protein
MCRNHCQSRRSQNHYRNQNQYHPNRSHQNPMYPNHHCCRSRYLYQSPMYPNRNLMCPNLSRSPMCLCRYRSLNQILLKYLYLDRCQYHYRFQYQYPFRCPCLFQYP